MTLHPGTRIGPYDIVAMVGAGGMGEVYRARDSRLKRDVAIKALPESLAADPERLARFEREAQLLAALSHQNIAAIYGLESESSALTRAAAPLLVMEFVEGQTLAELIVGRTTRAAAGDANGAGTGRVLTLADVLPIARQIALALEAAHDRGIVHRDLKPANIKVTANGRVKVLDFGLAKALDAMSNVAASEPSSLDAPAITSPAAVTAHGMILGTAAYMAPEQARGQTVDKRADIWAFGVVLYEMLTGRPLFSGETASDVMAAVLTREIDWHALPERTPASLERLLHRCLERDPHKRLRDIGDAHFDLDDVSIVGAADRTAGARTPPPAARVWRTTLLLAGVGLTAAAVTFAVMSSRASPTAANRAFVFPLSAPPHTRLHSVVVSPDGRALAYAAESSSGVRHLWVRELDSRDVRRFEGTEGARDPFWSPDSRFIGYFTEGQLWKIDVASGSLMLLAEATLSRGGAWNRDGDIVFSSGSLGSLNRVSASGGDTTEAVALDTASGENALRYPSFLPDGKHVLIYVRNAMKRDLAGLWVVSLDTGTRKRLGTASSSAVYAEPGYLLLRRDRYLVAQPFNSDRLEFVGDPITIAEDVWYDTSMTALTNVSVSSTGTLVYRTGGAEVSDLAWFDRKGERLGVVWEPKSFVTVALSPDGTKVLTGLPGKSAERDTWLYDLATATARQVTSSGDLVGNALFSSDGTRAALTLYTEAGFGVWLTRLGSGVRPEQLVIGDVSVTDWRGDWVIAQAQQQREDLSLYLLDLSNGQLLPLIDGPANEEFGVVSPDGRWIAYSSDATGERQIYVETFARTGERWRISNDGGHQPRWHPKGSELFYLAPDRRMMSARVGKSAAAFQWDEARPLFQTAIVDLGPSLGSNSYAVAPDGERFLILTLRSQEASPAVAMLDWAGRLGGR